MTTVNLIGWVLLGIWCTGSVVAGASYFFVEITCNRLGKETKPKRQQKPKPVVACVVVVDPDFAAAMIELDELFPGITDPMLLRRDYGGKV